MPFELRGRDPFRTGYERLDARDWIILEWRCQWPGLESKWDRSVALDGSQKTTEIAVNNGDKGLVFWRRFAV